MSNAPQQTTKTTFTESMAGVQSFQPPQQQPAGAAHDVDTSSMRGFNGFTQPKNDGGMR